MRKAIKSLMLPSGFIGLLIAVSLALFQWRILWQQNHLPPGGLMLDWSPYDNFLADALNWWVPFSILLCGASVLVATKYKPCKALFCAWCLHAVSISCLVSLGLWVFTVPLPRGGAVWWMLWNKS
jgi:hypothetical protein